MHIAICALELVVEIDDDGAAKQSVGEIPRLRQVVGAKPVLGIGEKVERVFVLVCAGKAP